eukprot:26794-Chlamydomonas_euryale.AAC.1
MHMPEPRCGVGRCELASSRQRLTPLFWSGWTAWGGEGWMEEGSEERFQQDMQRYCTRGLLHMWRCCVRVLLHMRRCCVRWLVHMRRCCVLELLHMRRCLRMFAVGMGNRTCGSAAHMYWVFHERRAQIQNSVRIGVPS